ncbi:hypothetical protein GUY44_11880 [Pimelobacter simplex]|uniref:Uncharacterized protein n=1 Tax=Nocardioides simplex TaxID=2045 RepID=A0A0A1DFR4_NOCSI|nr:hypothetical protein [Pimelobacter simplex]AIY16131.1 hypothetical protein KR76_04015 [Pimelobacter simplex]MCG8151181.1 hypothetical protein [Pimelobacter simplex]GEB17226.1 hypothetical protein NSI01_55410 [Pimelobacter simplex]SFM98407.1 hypothetical protein SAMN05421671_4539 [Pimelobacter simplex]
MTQEPGAWQLQQRLDERLDKIDANQQAGFDRLDKRFDRLVTTEAFNAEQRRVDDKIKDLADDIAAERDARRISMIEEKAAREDGDKRQQSALDKLIANQKWIVVTILIPIALFIANLVIDRSGS